MRIAIYLLAALGATISLHTEAVSADTNPDPLPAYLGQVNAWRLTPSTLLAQCAKEAPEQELERQATFDAWSRANEKLISSIERVVNMAAAQFSNAAGLSPAEAKDHINAATMTQILENYFQDKSITVTQVCAGYSEIVAGLSTSGKIAATRGHVYTVEGLLAARQPSATKPSQGSSHAQPIIPADLSRQAAPVR